MATKQRGNVRRVAKVASPLLLLAGLTLLPGSGASASCIGQSLAVSSADARIALRPGAEVRVDGQGYFVGCNDTGVQGSDGLGCEGTQPPAPGTPMNDVRLVLRQAGHTWTLSSADARPPAGDIAWTVRVPAGVHAGSAILQAGTARLRISIS